MKKPMCTMQEITLRTLLESFMKTDFKKRFISDMDNLGLSGKDVKYPKIGYLIPKNLLDPENNDVANSKEEEAMFNIILDKPIRLISDKIEFTQEQYDYLISTNKFPE